MSATDAIVTAGSAAVVALLVLIAFLMGFRQAAKLDAETLANELSTAEPKARIADAVFAADGRAALARLADGKLLIARVMADGVSLRLIAADAAKLRLRDGQAVLAFADIGFPALNLKLKEEAPSWLKALAGEQT
ncbi:hypothetical protein U91I_03774 [alpha proteobacterium U9-1i]|nr:hypothetical protein U91I_03774 [alpha proteobacterium U9-1i]